MTSARSRRGAERTPADVFDEHLRRAAAGDTEEDIAANYAEDCVLLTGIGELRGHEGVRESRSVLAEDLGEGSFEYVTRLVAGDFAFLEWRAKAQDVHIEDGADTFVIRNGLIRMQSIHYTVRHRTGYHRAIKHAP